MDDYLLCVLCVYKTDCASEMTAQLLKLLNSIFTPEKFQNMCWEFTLCSFCEGLH